MKKIINGRKYNTETAKRLAGWDNNRSYSDFSYCSEELYKKKTGEFFLYGDGGAMTKYRRNCGQNCWGGGENIVPLTELQAKQWAEEHLDCDKYEEIFGEVEE